MNAPLIERASDGRRLFQPDGDTLAAFLLDRSEISIIRGPWGSGKSVACCHRIWQHAVEQNLDSLGRRRSRWFVVRESYPKIETTAMQTWLEWFPESTYGRLYTGNKPYLHEVRVGNICLDVFFVSIDDAMGDAAFKSLEPNGWWWNELEYASMRQFFSAHGRVGRYPPVIEGGSAWSGTIADTNAPPENHWLPMLTGEVDLPDDMPLDERMAFERPPGMTYFVQPPAVHEKRDARGRIMGFKVNAKAENLKFLRDPYDGDIAGERYYERVQRGHTIKWIQAQLGNKLVPMVEGDAVWSNFNEDVHMADAGLEPIAGLAVGVGLDFGRRPAALFGQRVDGQFQIQFEAAMTNAGASKFAPEVRAVLTRFYPWASLRQVEFWGDPKGADGVQTDEQTAYDVFASHGMLVRPAPVKQNNIKTRVEAVEFLLDKAPGGRPALLISPRCRRLRLAMAGGYRYPKERPSPLEERKPVKDAHSDIADALQYLSLGWGAGRDMIGRDGANRSKPVSTRPDHVSRRRIGRAR